MIHPADYNRLAYHRCELLDEHIEWLVRHFQKTQGLTVDGKAGPKTRAELEALFDRSMK